MKVNSTGILAFLDLQGDNIPNKLIGKTIIGIVAKKIEIESLGRLFVIKLKNGSVFIRRIFPSDNQEKILILKEENNFSDIPLSMKEIYSTHMIVSAYLKELI